MKWIESLKSIAESGDVGECPECGSKNTDYLCRLVDKKNKNGYMDLWCNDCLSAFHVSRLRITDKMKTTGKMPEGLKY